MPPSSARLRPTLLLAALAGLAAPLAGCLEPEVAESVDEGEYLIAGRLAEDVTQAQTEELRAHVAARGAGLLLMESFPMRYQVRPLDAGECEDVRRWLQAREYVVTVGGCYSIRDPLEPEATPRVEPWWVPEEERAGDRGG